MVTFGSRGHDVVEGPTTPSQLGEACERLGVRNLQLALSASFPQWSDADRVNPGLLASIRRELASHDVEVAIMGCYFNMIHPDLEERERGIVKFQAYLSVARSLGCGIVASETGSVDPTFAYTEDNFTDEAFEAAVETIRRLVTVAEKTGVVVAVEPGVNHPIHDVDTVGRLLERVDSPCLGLILDPTALVTPSLADRQLEIVDQMLQRFSSRIVAAHLADYRIQDGLIKRCNLGEGVMDAPAILDMIDRSRPGGYVITEFTTGDAIKDAMDKLNSH